MEELKKEPKFQSTGKPGNWNSKWQAGLGATEPKVLATAHGAFLGGLRAPTRTPVRSSARSFVSMDVSKGVVITGGAGGVGYAYADSFLARGHWVVICDVKDPADAVAALRAKHASVPNAKIEGCASWCSTSFSSEHCGKCSCITFLFIEFSATNQIREHQSDSTNICA